MGGTGNSLLQKLSGGDRRTLGRVNEVIDDVKSKPALFDEVFHAILHDDPVIAMRASDVVEKVTRDRPELLNSYRNLVLELLPHSPLQEVRWHTAQLFGRIQWNEEERAYIIEILCGWLDHKSSILRTFAMQGLVDQVKEERRLLPDILPIIEECTASGTPAMRARGRKLIKELVMLSEEDHTD